MDSLTIREYQIADLVHQGMMKKEIAEKLCISPETVHTHLKNIRAKVHARNAADITRIFMLKYSNYKIHQNV